MLVPLAHAGHILIDAPIFLGPVAVVGAWIALVNRRDRRQRDRSGRD